MKSRQPAPTAQQQQQLIALLALLAAWQRQSAPAAPSPLRPQIALDRGAVGAYVKQASLDQGLSNLADTALGFAKENVEAAAGTAVGSALGITGLAQTGILSGAAPEILSTLAAAAPAAAVATTVLGLGIGLFDAFGGDFSIPTYATTPQLDATTALGQAAAKKAAIRIKTNLAAGVGKYSDAGDYAATLGG